MFKEKSTKKRIITPQNTKDASTLDARHQQVIQQMAQQQANLHQLLETRDIYQQQKAYWEGEIERMKNEELVDTREYDTAWTSNLHFTEKLKTLQNRIKDIEDSKEEIEYYENTANILFQYYELLENQTQTPTQTISLVPTRATKGKKKLLPIASKSILDALNINPKEPAPEDDAPSPIPKVVTQGVDKSTLVDEYLSKIDPYHVKAKAATDNFGNCEECNTPLMCLQQDGIMVCPECGYQELLLVEQNRPILRQPTKETSHFSYKRLNHFKNSLEWNSRHDKVCYLLVGGLTACAA